MLPTWYSFENYSLQVKTKKSHGAWTETIIKSSPVCTEGKRKAFAYKGGTLYKDSIIPLCQVVSCSQQVKKRKKVKDRRKGTRRRSTKPHVSYEHVLPGFLIQQCAAGVQPQLLCGLPHGAALPSLLLYSGRIN